MSAGAWLFCRMVAGDLPGAFVARDEQAVMFMDVIPATPDHLPVLPGTLRCSLAPTRPDLLAARPDDHTAKINDS